MSDSVVNIQISPAVEPVSLFLRFFLFLDGHILQFAGLENLSALLAFNILGFFIPRDNLNLRVLALLRDNFLLRRTGRLAKRHKLKDLSRKGMCIV